MMPSKEARTYILISALHKHQNQHRIIIIIIIIIIFYVHGSVHRNNIPVYNSN
jgi:hypothetical protein